MSTAKRIWKFLSSMRFAILLLVILAAACAVGSMVTQGQTYAWYAQRYSERTAAIIVALHLDDAFHSWWFLLINGFLCLNLLACNLTRLPQLIRRTRTAGDAQAALRAQGEVTAENVADPRAAFAKLHMPAPVEAQTADGRSALFAVRHRAGLWGAWVCHLGILLLIVGFSLGQMTKWTSAVYGVPGQSRPIEGTDYILTIDSFDIGLRDDDTVEQYTTAFTLRSTGDGPSGDSAVVSVNNPASLYGMKFYQNSTGWAARVTVQKDGELLQQAVVCTGEYLAVQDKPDLVIYLNAFYPDYVMTPGVGPSTASGQLNNPAYLYSVYYQERMLGMNALMQDEELTIDEYTVTFDQPQTYTLIQVKRDRFTWLALVGGLVTLAGLFLAFYIQPVRVWAIQDPEGGWTLHGTCHKGGALFRERFLSAAGKSAEEPNAIEDDHREDDLNASN